MEERQGLPIIAFASAQEWQAWLDEHAADAAGVWVKIAKKGAGVPSVTYAGALEAALCVGWIDGQKGAYDDAWWLQRFTRRGPRSIWSKINVAAVEALTLAGRMQPAGLAAVAAAKADGRWAAAYEGQRTATVPADLQAALDASPTAAAGWAGLNGANRYAVLFRVHGAKRPETRIRRIEKYVAMLERGEKLYPLGG